jgi:hypothetical protein
MGPEDPLQFSKGPATGSYPEMDELTMSPHLHTGTLQTAKYAKFLKHIQKACVGLLQTTSRIHQ